MRMQRLFKRKKGTANNSDETSEVVDDDSVTTSIQTIQLQAVPDTDAQENNDNNDGQVNPHSRDNQQREPQSEPHTQQVLPFLFPTLADLPGLLVSTSPGSVFQRSQWQQIRRRYLDSVRGQVEAARPEIEARGKNVDLPITLDEDGDFEGRHFIKIPITTVTESGHEINLEEEELVEVVDKLSEPQIVPTKVDAFLASHRQSEEDDGMTNDASKAAAVQLVGEDIKAAYYRGIYLTLLFLGLIILTYAGGATFIFLKLTKAGNPYTCRTPNCERMAYWIKSAMDVSVNPCDNFYYFACGTHIKAQPVGNESPNERNLYRNGIPINFMENEQVGNMLKKVDTFPDNQLLTFYQACIDTRRRNKHGVLPFLNLLAQIRLLYIQSGAYFSVVSRFKIGRVMGRVYRRTNRLFFFDFDEVKDNIMLFKLAKPSTEILLTPPKVYADAMRKTWKIFSNDLMIDDEEIETIVYVVMRFEAELGIIQSKETANYIFGFPVHFDEMVPPPAKFHPNYIKMRGRFEWHELVAAVMGYTPGNFEEYKITFNLWSSIYSKQDRYYILYMEDKLRNTPFYVIFRYFQWELMKMFAFDLNNEIQEIMLAIFRTSGRNTVERCFRSIFSNLHFVAAHRYKAMISDTVSIHNNMTAITDKVFQVYSETVSKLDLPIAMKASLLHTSKALKIIMMDPESKLDGFLATYYKGLKTSKEHFSNVMHAKSIKARNVIMFATKTPPFDKWWDGDYSLTESTETSIANAWSTVRYLHVPFGALQEPFMDNDLPILNYAGFGHYLVAVSLMKFAFDDLFQVYDSNYRIWEPKTEVTIFKDFQQAFLDITECVVSTQTTLRLKEFPDIKINPDMVRETKVRMISQTFALELTNLVIDSLINATKAKKGSITPYKSPMDELLHANEMIGERFPKHQVLPGLEQYSPVQLFFLSMARHHCQSHTRAKAESRLNHGPLLNEIVIHGSFRNLIDFAKIWQCPKDSFMYPRKNCRLFTGKKQVSDKNQDSDLLNYRETGEHTDDVEHYYDDDNE